MDKDLRDDMLKLVKYRVLFVKREYETSFGDDVDVIDDNLDGAALTAWKTAEFIQVLADQGRPIPPKWGGSYPGADNKDPNDPKVFRKLPEEDKKYLRLSYEVLDRYPRERFKYEEQQIRVLEQIKDKLP